MKLYPLIAAAIVFGFGLTSCGSDTDKTAENKDENLSKKIEFRLIDGKKIYILENSSRDFDLETDLTFQDFAEIVMPTVLYGNDIKTLCDTIMSLSFGFVESQPEKAMEKFFADAVEDIGYTAVETEDSTLVNDYSGYAGVKGDVYSLTSKRLTYCVSRFTYMPGAAHGMESCRYVTYDLTKGQILSLDDLFTPKGLSELPTLISRRAKRMENILGPTYIDGLPADGNFYINVEEQIVFVYQPYEVASYAQGFINIPFYPYELSEYFSKRGLEFFGLNE